MSASYCLRHRRYSSSFNYSTKVVKYDSKTSTERYISVDANASDILLLIIRVFLSLEYVKVYFIDHFNGPGWSCQSVVCVCVNG